jgi:formamidopyrimidine-DNA glycosylase
VYGKVGCSAEAFKKAMTGKKVLDARQQGKYFWMEMESAPHPVCGQIYVDRAMT